MTDTYHRYDDGESLAARPKPDALPHARLGELVWNYHGCWRLCDRMRQALASLALAKAWVVAGETQLLTELDERLAAALKMLEALGGPAGKAIGDRFAEQVEHPVWDLARLVADDLQAKLARQEEFFQQKADALAEWRDEAASLRRTLEGAKKVRAPILREEADFRKLEALVAQAERMLKEPNYAELLKCLALLEPQRSTSQAIVQSVKDKVADAANFIRQSDLLLLESPPDPTASRVHYTVLLRTPSEPGTHGVNVQASSTLVKQDSLELRDALRRVTDAINTGLTRSFDEAAAARNVTAMLPARPAAAAGGINELIQDVGELMYRLVIPEQMQPFLIDTTSSVTITTNDLELPWELMYARENFFCLSHSVARMPMGRALPRRARVRGDRTKLRFLLVYADPIDNLPKARDEVTKIGAALRNEWGDRIEVDTLEPPNSSGKRLTEALRKGTYDVVHYAGHACFDDTDGDLSGLLLHGNEMFFAQKVRRLLEGRPLVFLNACESACTANEQVPQRVDKYLQVPAEGLASAFIYGGAVGCIGSLWPVYDGPAADFAVAFYRGVLEGYSIGEAMRAARIASRKAYPNQVTWATFVLYGDPRFQLVD